MSIKPKNLDTSCETQQEYQKNSQAEFQCANASEVAFQIANTAHAIAKLLHNAADSSNHQSERLNAIQAQEVFPDISLQMIHKIEVQLAQRRRLEKAPLPLLQASTNNGDHFQISFQDMQKAIAGTTHIFQFEPASRASIHHHIYTSLLAPLAKMWNLDLLNLLMFQMTMMNIIENKVALQHLTQDKTRQVQEMIANRLVTYINEMSTDIIAELTNSKKVKEGSQ